jgi:hypothetical protein
MNNSTDGLIVEASGMRLCPASTTFTAQEQAGKVHLQEGTIPFFE